MVKIKFHTVQAREAAQASVVPLADGLQNSLPPLFYIWGGSPTAADSGLKIHPVTVRIRLALPYAQVAQWQEAIVLGTIQCQFESDLEYHTYALKRGLRPITYLICLLTEHGFPLNYSRRLTWSTLTGAVWSIAVGRAVNK